MIRERGSDLLIETNYKKYISCGIKPLVDTLVGVEQNLVWEMRGAKISSEVDRNLRGKIEELFRLKTQKYLSHKENLDFEKFLDSYNTYASPYRKMRRYLDNIGFVGSLKNFEMYKVNDDTDVFFIKNSVDSDKSVYALSAEYLIGGNYKGRVMSFFDLYFLKSRDWSKTYPMMGVFSFVEMQKDMEDMLIGDKSESYFDNKVFFYTGITSKRG